MVQYRDLNAPPSRMLADVVADMKAQERQSKTGDAGVKDLGTEGDVVWPRPDGTPVSVRDVDLDLADARQRIEDAEASLAENGSRLTAAEQGVQDVRDELAAIEVGEGGPLIHPTPPGPADGEGKPAGTAWLVYGQDGTLTSVWQWGGAVWEEMPLDTTLIPLLDIGSGTFGDLEGSRLTVNDLLAARIVQAMDLETKKLVVTEQAILNHATLIGQTVVDDINVQGKLIGRDGTFTGTVDFENVNVTGELLANEISGEHIYGTVIEGGEVRTGTDETRGKFLLGDGAYVNPEDGYVTPGLRFTPPNSTHVHQPALGVVGGGIRISGGKSAEGRLSTLAAAPGGVTVSAAAPAGSTERLASLDVGGSTGVRMVSNLRDDSENVSIVAAPSINYSGGTFPSRAQLVVRSGSQRGEVAAYGDGRAQISTGGATPRSLRVDSAGVWATEGSTQVSLIPEVRQFQYSSQWNADQSPAHIMVQHLPGGKLCQAQIRIQNLTGSRLSLPYDTWVQLNYNPIPSDLRGGFTDYIEVTLPQLNARGRVEMNYSTGRIRVKALEKDKDGNPITIDWHNNNSIWFPMRWFSPN